MSNLAEAMEKYLTMGERMGLKGPELKAFLDKQQEVEKTRLNEERDERAAARAREKEKLDHELALAKAKQDQELALAKAKQDQEITRVQEQHVLAQEQAALAREREVREKARQDQEFALARIHDSQEKERREEEFILTRSRVDREQAQLEKEQILALAREEREQAMVLARMTHEREMRKLDRANAGGGDRDHENDDADISVTPVSARSSSNKFFGPKIPAFDEVHDCMDSYLQRFERYAEGQKWVPDLWAHYLSALLKGKALDVYGRLSTDQAKDYAFVKDALLKRFQLTEEGFKTTFYTSKVEVGESPTQFIARLSNYLTRWIDLSGIDKSYESLKELMIREQYLNISPKD